MPTLCLAQWIRFLQFGLFYSVWSQVSCQVQQGLDAPLKSDDNPPDIEPLTLGAVTFEGVDYDMLPEKQWQYHHDCNARFIHCVESMDHLNTVCRFEKGKPGDVLIWTMCEFEFHNCNERLERAKPPFGEQDVMDEIFGYGGEGWDCRSAERFYINVTQNSFLYNLFFGQEKDH